MHSPGIESGDATPLARDTGRVAPPHAPFVFDDYRPSPALALLVSGRALPALGLFLAGALWATMTLMVVAGQGPAEPADGALVERFAPPLALMLMGLVARLITCGVARLPQRPARAAEIAAVREAARAHGTLAPMLDAQSRTGDTWRLGHIRQAWRMLEGGTARRENRVA